MSTTRTAAASRATTSTSRSAASAACAPSSARRAPCEHTGQYELSFYSRDYTVFDKDEMVRSGEGFRATGAEMPEGAACGKNLAGRERPAPDSTPANPEDAHAEQEVTP